MVPVSFALPLSPALTLAPGLPGRPTDGKKWSILCRSQGDVAIGRPWNRRKHEVRGKGDWVDHSRHRGHRHEDAAASHSRDANDA